MLKTKLINKTTMGQSRPIICNECGNHWTHMDGSGFRSSIYYCDLCANQKNLSRSKSNNREIMYPVSLKQCECNVNFELDKTILCPECQSTDLEIGSKDSPLSDPN